MKRIELILARVRKRQSPVTGFYHGYPRLEFSDHTIPFYENLCFVFALFQSQDKDNVLEGRSLLHKLLAFEIEEGKFPLYLHEYPNVSDPYLSLKTMPIFLQMMRYFSKFLGEELFGMLQELQKRVRYELPKSPLWWHRYQRIHQQPSSYHPETINQWVETILSDQLLDPPPEQVSLVYHSRLGLALTEKREFIGLHCNLSAIEAFLGKETVLETIPEELLLKSALLFDFRPVVVEDTWSFIGDQLFWGDAQKIYSCVVDHPTQIQRTAQGGLYFFKIEEPFVPDKKDIIEAGFFLSAHPDIEIDLPEGKGTCFSLNTPLKIRSAAGELTARFFVHEGHAECVGQLTKANRPRQTASSETLKFSAFDWWISLRTLRRSDVCTLALEISTC